MVDTAVADADVTETQEWLDALASVIKHAGAPRAQFLLKQLSGIAAEQGVSLPSLSSAYVNTLPTTAEARLPDDESLFTRLGNILRWNALMIVLKATGKAPELGGHLASYASIATLYEVGLNYFFHAEHEKHGGDLVFFQGHSSPGLYARSLVEGRFSPEFAERFRQEVQAPGLSSYPHPWLMPDYWQFPTVSMGLGLMQAIYQARFMKYMQSRELIPTDARKIWCFCGDGEMDEPESLGALTVAGREGLDNLIVVINCNLQRLDGPVRGNSKIIQELESLFRGAGWNVIKVVWDRHWDPLLANDHDGLLRQRMAEVVDGEYQSYVVNDGAYMREHFFGKYPALKERVAHLTDEEIEQLGRGGSDAQKVFAAYSAAAKQTGQPTVVLAKTVKGFGMGEAGEALNTTHQQKKMTTEQLKVFRDRFNLPLTDEQVENRDFLLPAEDSPEVSFLKTRRTALGGTFPTRRTQASESLPIPALSAFEPVLKGSGDREISTTMAFVRLLSILLKDKALGSRIVPIVPDESRTFGMEGMFRQFGIYSPWGQLYTPVDHAQIMSYREDKKGQMLQEGINEGGAFCSWMAAATSYSHHNHTMIPFYIYYSMFGFQRIGDFAWAAGDMQARGFLLGGTAGRTTLAGEGLQHQDGHSHVLANTIPNCVTYDPTFGYELAVIIQHGLKRMVEDQENVFFYLTVMNENYQQPAMPEGVEEGILQGLYRYQTHEKAQIQLMGSGTILLEVIQAAALLEADYNIGANIWSATSMNELAREGRACHRYNQRHLGEQPRVPYVTQCFSQDSLPVLAATDYMHQYTDQIRAYVPTPYCVLGTDGFGRSDTRAQLRHFFEVDAKTIAYAALKHLADQGSFPQDKLEEAQKRYEINPDKPDPMTV